MLTLRLWSPLDPFIYPMNEWGDQKDQPESMSSAEIIRYMDDINTILKKYSERGFFPEPQVNEALQNKIYSITPSVDEWNGALWGVAVIKLNEALTSDEMLELTERLEADYADGWGEWMEQNEIKIEDGWLHISFWNDSDRYSIKPEQELKGGPELMGL